MKHSNVAFSVWSLLVVVVRALGSGSQVNLNLNLLSPQDDTIPETVVLNGTRLIEIRANLLQDEDPTSDLNVALEHLKSQANVLLKKGPWTVTTTSKLPPSNDSHDYASQAPYFWPENGIPGDCSHIPGDCPYVQRDGHRNPEVKCYPDHDMRQMMLNSTYLLSLAWFYTGEDQYAIHAGLILRTWFLDPDTRMNPNLNHAQMIPCSKCCQDGRAVGIIDFSESYTNILDAAAILAAGAPGWNESDQASFLEWNKDFLTWLTTSEFGKCEAGGNLDSSSLSELTKKHPPKGGDKADEKDTCKPNNHATFANMQIAALALFVGDAQLAKDTVEKAKTLIKLQIRPNGSQPLELIRTRSWHYSNFNLGALLRFALVSEKVGVDLFRYEAAEEGGDGQNTSGSIFKATEFLIPAALGGAKVWKNEMRLPELKFTQYAASDNIRAAADAGDEKSIAVVAGGKLKLPPNDFYILRPAPEQVDGIGYN